MPVKPSQQEEEYHARLEFERRKKVEEGRREQKEIDEIALTRHGRRVLETPGDQERP